MTLFDKFWNSERKAISKECGVSMRDMVKTGAVVDTAVMDQYRKIRILSDAFENDPDNQALYGQVVIEFRVGCTMIAERIQAHKAKA